MCSGSVVVVEVLSEDAVKMSLVEHHNVIETLPAQRADDTLGDGIGLRSPNRREQGLDTESGSTRNEGRAVATVPVANQLARLLAPRCRCDELAPDPFGGRVRADLAMTGPATPGPAPRCPQPPPRPRGGG